LSAAQERAKTRRVIGWVLLAGAGLFGFGWMLMHWPGRDRPVLNEGTETLELTMGGKLKGMSDADAADRALVATALSQRRLPLPDFLAELRQRPEGGPPEKAVIVLRQPVGTAVMDTEPVFRWLTVPGQWVYRVTVDDGKGDVLASEDAVRPGLWHPSTDLPVNVTLRWQVTATDPTGALISSGPAAQFLVVDASTRGRLVSLRLQHANLHALLAVEFASEGLVPEAQSELAQLTPQNPNSALLFRWMTSLEDKSSTAAKKP
jgi:hypothetical protein